MTTATCMITIVRIPAGKSSPLERIMSIVGRSDIALTDTLHDPTIPRRYAIVYRDAVLDVICFDDRIAEALLRGEPLAQLITRVEPETFKHPPDGRTLRLAFETPAHFRVAGLDYLIPDPFHVFGGLLERWNDLGFEPIDAPNIRRLAVEPEQLLFRRFSEHRRGFLGVVRFDAIGLSDIDQQRIWQLARFAEYRGIGAHTSYGMGRVRILKWRERWQPDQQLAVWDP